MNNDLAAQINENPDRFRGFATLPLYDPAAAADELRRCVGDLGFVGALIAGSYDGLFLDDTWVDPILTAAEALDLPIYVFTPAFPRRPFPSSTTPAPGLPRCRSCSPDQRSDGTPKPASTLCG